MFGVTLLVLTLPAGLVGYVIFGYLYDAFGHQLGWQGNSDLSTLSSLSYYLVMWVLMVVPAYLLWFTILPRILARRARANDT